MAGTCIKSFADALQPLHPFQTLLGGCFEGVLCGVLLWCSGQLETPDAGVTYIMDVLEEVGADVARRCYWDFGDWSDLWRETKHVPPDVTLPVS